MGRPAIDEIGNVHNMWTVLGPAEKDGHKGAHWLCRCECGREKVVNGTALRLGNSKSCGHPKDLTGEVFGRWVVLSRAENDTWGGTRWNCQCQCGEKKTVPAGKLRSGESKSCGLCDRSGVNSPSWRGGRHLNSEGYVRVHAPDHPAANHNRVPEHRLVMEKHLGRYLTDEETIHHKNGVRDDNAIGNLELWVSKHPSGQRVTDLQGWAHQILEQYPYMEPL